MEGDRPIGVGDVLLLIHQTISRGLHMSGLYSRIYKETGMPGGKIGRGFADYIRSLASVLYAHHLAEDEIAFPLFRALLPEAPYQRLAEEHRRLEPIVDEIRTKIERAPEGGDSEGSLERIDSLLARMGGIWGSHIAVEEDHFSPEKIDAVMGADEQLRLLGRISEANLEHSGPDYLVMPFTLFNLPEKDRADMSGLMPPVVTKHLIPVAWKEKWQPMSPFLLI